MKKLFLAISLVIASLVGFSQSTYELLLVNNILAGKYDKVLACTKSSNFNLFTLNVLDSNNTIRTQYVKEKPGLFINTKNINSKPVFTESDIVNELKNFKKYVGISDLKQLNKVTNIDTLSSWSIAYSDFKIVDGDMQNVAAYTKAFIFNKIEGDVKTARGIIFNFEDGRLVSIGISYINFEFR